MKYYISKSIRGNYAETVEKVKELLPGEGFGVLTEIDVKATLKKKLDVDYKNYIILGACNPHLAYQAFQSEDKVGTLLPCNVVVIEQEGGIIEIAVMDALGMMSQIGNPAIEELAADANDRLARVLDKL